MSRMSCDSTPCGSVYASILSSAARRTSPGESTSALVIARFEQAFVREVRRAERRAITHADDAHRRQAARPALGEKAALDRGEQRLGHRVSAAGTADQDRVAVLDELRRFVCSDLFHWPCSLIAP